MYCGFRSNNAHHTKSGTAILLLGVQCFSTLPAVAQPFTQKDSAIYAAACLSPLLSTITTALTGATKMIRHIFKLYHGVGHRLLRRRGTLGTLFESYSTGELDVLVPVIKAKTNIEKCTVEGLLLEVLFEIRRNQPYPCRTHAHGQTLVPLSRREAGAVNIRSLDPAVHGSQKPKTH
ncbi:hypothetical protein BKA59DRAFT_523140 [Fusarium tricinctum]|uniref:Uncharacterized protein n=1 Tax=Fusarium tricinctum TaxID=61284 RepID=A0A8K0S9G4_9HYPO|nr:hypothetical protein BKA59DRAFT_523140 [Fusarium tricinctum]